MSELHKSRVAILASGSGTTAEAFVDATQDGRVDAEVGMVICNKPPDQAGIYERIGNLNKLYGLDIETAYISRQTYPDGRANRGQTLEESAAICRKIADGGYDHVALMGYMIIIRGDLMDEYGYHPDEHTSIYQARMSNTHPGPLPETEDTYGLNASAKVLELGMPFSRHTFHLVSPGVDRGPVLDQHSVEVRPGDTPETLFERVQRMEKRKLPLDIDGFLEAQRAYAESRENE
ncbi:MAG TPA: formyltransferase family protein [Candidatus Saccharimonadales bacterium]|nr:formyltransferase family protein [Candidatus Saccharimonadales bacterium]